MAMEKIINELSEKALMIRRKVLQMIHKAKAGHPGGSLSVIELLAALYFNEMKIDPDNPKWPERDRFILSKGHAAPALYATLATRGYFDDSILFTLDEIGSPLQGHPDMRKTEGVDMSTGSLGQGISVANGIALGAKMANKDIRVYVLVGDGEMQEGQIWEAIIYGGQKKLDNLVLIIDDNGLQLSDFTSNIINLRPFKQKLASFNWHVIDINGHDFNQIISAFKEARETKNKPTAIVAKTIKGKGVSFMENKLEWHSKALSNEELQKALLEIS